jgi:hypothetical protein
MNTMPAIIQTRVHMPSHSWAANSGEYPFFERGVKTRLVPDDGSKKWRETYEKARKKPFFA